MISYILVQKKDEELVYGINHNEITVFTTKAKAQKIKSLLSIPHKIIKVEIKEI